MLRDIVDSQESEETVNGVDLSLTIQTRSGDREEAVRRTYTFSYAGGMQEWQFSEFEEERTERNSYGNVDKDAEWTRTQHYWWHDPSAPKVDVPPEVTEAMEEALDADEVIFSS